MAEGLLLVGVVLLLGLEEEILGLDVDIILQEGEEEDFLLITAGVLLLSLVLPPVLVQGEQKKSINYFMCDFVNIPFFKFAFEITFKIEIIGV